MRWRDGAGKRGRREGGGGEGRREEKEKKESVGKSEVNTTNREQRKRDHFHACNI